MPEGDTLFRTAAGLRPYLVGRDVTAARAQGPGAVPQVHRVVGQRIDAVEAHGKNLLIRFDGGLELRTHLRMHGLVASLPTGRALAPAAGPGAARPRGPGLGRGLLRRPGRRAVRAARRAPCTGRSRSSARTCSTPPSMPTRHSAGCAIRPGRTSTSPWRCSTSGRWPGIGNVIKNEVLWIERVSPFAPVRDLDDATLTRLVATARRLLLANVDPRRGPERVTTEGDRGAPGPLYVYGRRGRPCRRCRTRIRVDPPGHATCPDRRTGVRPARARLRADDRHRGRLRRDRPGGRGPVPCGSATTGRATDHEVLVDEIDLPRGARRCRDARRRAPRREPRSSSCSNANPRSRSCAASTCRSWADTSRSTPRTSRDASGRARRAGRCPGVSSRLDVRALRRARGDAVPTRRAVAVHRAPRAVRDRRVRLGRGLARRADGGLASHRDVRAFRDDPEGQARVGRRRDDGCPRPPAPPVDACPRSSLPDTQPFDDPAGRFASATTATCATTEPLRRRTRPQGRIHGRADTEVGARWLEDAWRRRRTGRPPAGRHARSIRGPGEPRRPDRRRRRRTTTRATARTRSSRSGSGRSASPRPASTRSTGRSSASSRRARRSVGSSGQRTTVSLDRNGAPRGAS